MEKEKRTSTRTKKLTLPVLPLRGLCIFPYMVLHFDVGRPKSIAALEQSMIGDQMIFLVSQKDAAVDEPQHKDCIHSAPFQRLNSCLLPGAILGAC